jgi:hypothetical protein
MYYFGSSTVPAAITQEGGTGIQSLIISFILTLSKLKDKGYIGDSVVKNRTSPV